MAEPSSSGRRTGRANAQVYTDFLRFMSDMRREREDFRYESDVDLLSLLSDDDTESDIANMSAQSSDDLVSSLTLDSLSGSDADYSSFDEMFSPGSMASAGYASEDEGPGAAGADPARGEEGAEGAAEASDDEPAAHSVDGVASEVEIPTTGEGAAHSIDVSTWEDASPARRPAKRRCSPSDAEAARCSICLDAWGAAGRHRVVALECGHVFGHGCIRTWLLGAKQRDRCCPTCKSRASLYDIRYLRPPLVASPEESELRERLRCALDEAQRAERAASHCSEENRQREYERRTLARELTLLRAKRVRSG